MVPIVLRRSFFPALARPATIHPFPLCQMGLFSPLASPTSRGEPWAVVGGDRMGSRSRSGPRDRRWETDGERPGVKGPDTCLAPTQTSAGRRGEA